MRTRFIALVLVSTLLHGCETLPIITDGFHSRFPEPHSIVLVRGNHQGAVDTADAWLQGYGVNIVPTTSDQGQPGELRGSLSSTPTDLPQLVDIGAALGADLVVYVATQTRPLVLRHPTSFESVRPSGKITLYAVKVSIVGLNVKTGETVWQGTAQVLYPIKDIDQFVTYLTCRALAAALGDQPPYHHQPDSETLCLAEGHAGVSG